MKPAIRVENLSKRYRIGTRSAGQYRTLREALVEKASGALKAVRAKARGGDGASSESPEDFWALKDVSFEVQPGEVVGIIGRNGAGKSTLLKILSRIAEPTGGRVELRGRVGSLLEVGTGFHPELTGRENIFLNGSILGMSRREIARQFDEIVAFAEIEKFLDTPVKRYSSGMYVRLAFAVAAHLDPETLIVDEVLAVGDADFQRKCLGKMGEVARDGRAVLIVSHNMAAVRTLCRRALVLRQGRSVFDGGTGSAIDHYLSYFRQAEGRAFADHPERSGSGAVRLIDACIRDEAGTRRKNLVAGRAAEIALYYENHSGSKRIDVVATIYNHLGVAVTNFSSHVEGVEFDGLAPRGEISCRLPRLPLPIGEYRIATALRVGHETVDWVPDAVVFDVDESEFFPTGQNPDVNYCPCLVDHTWDHRAGRPVVR